MPLTVRAPVTASLSLAPTVGAPIASLSLTVMVCRLTVEIAVVANAQHQRAGPGGWHIPVAADE